MKSKKSYQLPRKRNYPSTLQPIFNIFCPPPATVSLFGFVSCYFSVPRASIFPTIAFWLSLLIWKMESLE